MYPLFKRLAALALLLTAPVQAQLLPTPGHQGPPAATSLPGVPKVQPLWTMTTARADHTPPEVPMAWISGGRVLAYRPGALQARDLATGRVAWTVRDPGAVLAVTDSSVYHSQDRVLVRRDARTGRTVWKVTLPKVPYGAVAQNGALFLTLPGLALVLDGASGKERWRAEEEGLTGFAGSAPGVVFWQTNRGEPSFPGITAYDAATGGALYHTGATVGPLVIQGSQMLLKDFGVPGPDDEARLRWVDVRSGAVRRTLRLEADFRCPGTSTIQYGGRDAFYAAPHLYLLDQCGARLSQFEVGAPGEHRRAPIRRFAAPDEGRYRLGPVGGRLVFEGRAGEVRLIPTTGGRPITFSGAEMPTGEGAVLVGSGQVSRLDALGDTLYLGRTGGLMVAYSAAGTPKFQVRLPWNSFGPTLHAGPYTVLTTPGALAVVRGPR